MPTAERRGRVLTAGAGRFQVSRHFRRWAVRDLADWDADSPGIYDHRHDADAHCRRLNAASVARMNPTPTLFDKDMTMPAAPAFVTIGAAQQTPIPAGVLAGPADADHYRVKVGRYNDRWYTDPLPACAIAPLVDEDRATWPSVSSIKKASGKDWTHVGFKRVAKALEARPDILTGLSMDERMERLAGINRTDLKRAMDRGTNVHLYLEKGLRGLPIEPVTPGEPGEEYLPAVLEFFEVYQPKLIAAEVVCIHRDLHGVGYGGTSDGLISLLNPAGDRVIKWVDWKTRADESDHGAYPEEGAQLGAYSGAQYMIVAGPKGPERQRIPASDGGLIVSIKTSGVRLYPIDLDKAATSFSDLHAWWVAKRDERKCVGRPWAPRALPAGPDFAGLASLAAGVDDLMALHGQAVAAGQWNDAVKAAFSARKAELTQAAA